MMALARGSGTSREERAYRIVVGYRIEGLRPVKENKVEWKLLTFVEL